jgi:hypothetical protein
VAVVPAGESGDTYRSWDPDGTVREHRGERFRVVLANATARALRDVSVAGATVTTLDAATFAGPKEPRTFGEVPAGAAVELETLEDWAFDFAHRYEVRFRQGRGAHRLEYHVPRSAIAQAGWSDLPVLRVRGFRATGREVPPAGD